ncbi:hypothetical protein MBLNU457_2254t1 [Dothideomycetes sp. NU457]
MSHYGEMAALREQIIVILPRFEVIVCRFEERTLRNPKQHSYWVSDDDYNISDNNYVARVVDRGTLRTEVKGPVATDDITAMRGLYDLVLRDAGKRYAGME